MEPIFNDAVMLAGWKESHASGAVVSFFLPDAGALDIFRGMTVKKGNVAGQRLAMCLIEIGDDEKPVQAPAKPAAKDPNYFARDLVRDGQFRALKFWLAMHDAGHWTMQEHKKYVQTLPCCGHAFHPHQCNGDIVLHHADQAGDPAAGKRRQPENQQKAPHYYGAPVCHAFHTWIHNQADRQTKQDIRVYAIELTAKQMKEAVKRALTLTSLSDITPEMWEQFKANIGL